MWNNARATAITAKQDVMKRYEKIFFVKWATDIQLPTIIMNRFGWCQLEIHLPSRDIGRCISSGSRSAGDGTPARVKGGSLAQ